VIPLEEIFFQSSTEHMKKFVLSDTAPTTRRQTVSKNVQLNIDIAKLNRILANTKRETKCSDAARTLARTSHGTAAPYVIENDFAVRTHTLTSAYAE